jgi:hypothetical protein
METSVYRVSCLVGCSLFRKSRFCGMLISVSIRDFAMLAVLFLIPLSTYSEPIGNNEMLTIASSLIHGLANSLLISDALF